MKGSGRKVGRDKAKCKRYRDMNLRIIHKRKRILRSNGAAFLAEWERQRAR